MRTTRAPNNGKNAPPVRACRFARACIAREDRPRRGKAPWQTARFACRLARCACRSSSQKSHFAAIFGSPIFFPSGVSAVYLTFRQAKGAANAAPFLPPLQVRDRRNNVTRPRLRRTAVPVRFEFRLVSFAHMTGA